MKRFVAILLCLCCMLSLAACSAQNDDSGDDKKLVVWHDKEDAVVEAMQSYLHTAVPDLEIVFEKKTSLTDSLKLVGNDPNAAPDLFCLPTIKSVFLRRWGFWHRLLLCWERVGRRISSP